MNKVELLGRLTKDPDVRYANSGTSVCRFTVACDRHFKKEGEQTADFINCLSFGKQAEFIEKYFSKGKQIALTGRIQTGSYTNKDGQKVYTTEVLVEEVEFAGSSGGNNGAKESPSEAANRQERPSDDFMNIPDEIGEELPFA